EGEGSAFPGEGFRNSPRDRVVVGDPHDQPALALHQIAHTRPCSLREAHARLPIPAAAPTSPGAVASRAPSYLPGPTSASGCALQRRALAQTLRHRAA